MTIQLLCYIFLLITVNFPDVALAVITTSETASRINIANDRLSFSVSKKTGWIDNLSLDHQDLLGTKAHEDPTPGGPTGNGNSGYGPYLDCYCVTKGFYTPGKRATYRLIRGKDSGGVDYAASIMSDRHPDSGQVMEFYIFLRDTETGLHTFSRLAYKNATGPTHQVLQEFRTLFRPNTPLWTHMVTNNYTIAPLPRKENIKKAEFVQDATLDLGPWPDDPYVRETNRYFTKYSFADTWMDHAAHGLYGEGSRTSNGTWGAWMVMWNRETYYGGPLHSDLTVDGIVYDYMVSNHFGANVPKITEGFDKTFGPNYYHFNHFPASTPVHTLYKEASSYRPPPTFLEAAAKHVPNYRPPSHRSSFTISAKLPSRAKKSTVILSASGLDVQDNAESPRSYQYWATLDDQGNARINDIVPGTYRVTLYADDVFGQYTQDNIVISPPPPPPATPSSSPTPPTTTHFTATWTEESAGTELWRLGTPDHSSGEFRHGYTLDAAHPRGLQQYRIFYGAYNFDTDFPAGVTYRIGASTPARDWNYVQWAAGNSSTWYVVWRLDDHDGGEQAAASRALWKRGTLTLQAAGIRTAAGNEHYKTTKEVGKFAAMGIEASINGKIVGVWNAPHTVSGSCAVRSGVVCYNSAHKFVFDASILKPGENILGITLPKGASGGLGSAKLAKGLYAQWDALRLEVS